MVSHLDAGTVDDHVDRRPVGAVLHGVVDQVGHGPLDHVLADRDHDSGAGVGAVGPDDLDHPARPSPRPLGDPGRENGEVDRNGLLASGTIGREFHQFGQECRQLSGLELQVVDDGAPVLGGERAGRGQLGAGQQLQVGAKAGQGGTHLVRGVGDQSLLLVLGLCERFDHGREAGRQAADLVGSGGGHGCREVAGGSDVLGGRGESPDGSDDARRQGEPDGGGDHDARERDQQQADAEPVEHAIGFARFPGELDGAALGERHRDDTNRFVADPGPREGVVGVSVAVMIVVAVEVGAVRDGQVTFARLDGRTAHDALADLAVLDDLGGGEGLQHVDVGAAGSSRHEGLAVARFAAARSGRVVDRGARSLEEGFVDGAVELARRGHVGATGGECRDDPRERCERRRDLEAKTHVARAT